MSGSTHPGCGFGSETIDLRPRANVMPSQPLPLASPAGAVHPWLFWDCRRALGKVPRAGKPAKPNAVRCVLCAVHCACQLSEPSDPAFWKASPSSHAIPLYLIYPRCSQSTRECLKEGNWSKENETEGDVLVAWLFSRTLVLESLIFFSSFSNLDLRLVLLFTPIC